LRQGEIDHFRRNRHVYLEKVEAYKLANLGKVLKNRILDFSHDFYGKLI
jgi:hypothetical protein